MVQTLVKAGAIVQTSNKGDVEDRKMIDNSVFLPNVVIDFSCIMGTEQRIANSITHLKENGKGELEPVRNHQRQTYPV